MWSGFVSLCYHNTKLIDSSRFVILDSALNTLWKYYWRCVIEEQPWRLADVFQTFKLDHHHPIRAWVATDGNHKPSVSPLIE